MVYDALLNLQLNTLKIDCCNQVKEINLSLVNKLLELGSLGATVKGTGPSWVEGLEVPGPACKHGRQEGTV